MQCCLFYFVVLKYFFPFIYLRSIIATPTTLFYKTKFAETLILIYFHLAHLPTYLLHSLKSGRLLKIDSLQSLSKQANKHGCIKLTIKCCFKVPFNCGSVGRAVASDTRGPRFESSHWQKFIYIEHLFPVNCGLKRRK